MLIFDQKGGESYCSDGSGVCSSRYITNMSNRMSNPMFVWTCFVTCDLSYEHNCDLSSELPGVVVDFPRSTGGC